MEDIEKRFTYHKPTSEQIDVMFLIRHFSKSLAYFIDKTCPYSREKSISIKKLEECVMWANASIARSNYKGD